MSTSAIILKSENGEITYVVGEVVTKTKAQLESEIAKLSEMIAELKYEDVNLLKGMYEEELQALKSKYDKLIADAETNNAENEEALNKYQNEIDNLRAVLSTITGAESQVEEEAAQ